MIRSWIERVLSRKTGPTAPDSSDWDAVSARVRAEKTARQAAVEPYREVADAVSAVLFRRDPVGINFEDNTDEYDAEAEGIVLRLAAAPAIDSVETVEVIVHQEFIRWFDEKTAGPRDRYRDIATEILDVWSAAEQGESSERR